MRRGGAGSANANDKARATGRTARARRGCSNHLPRPRYLKQLAFRRAAHGLTRHGTALPWQRRLKAEAPPAAPVRRFARVVMAKPRRAIRRQRDAGRTGQRGGGALRRAFAGARQATARQKTAPPLAVTGGRQRAATPSLAMIAPLLRRTPRSANVGPGKAVPQRPPPPPFTPARREDWRAKAIRAAWAVLDWHTLKAFGQIDQIPEP